MLLALYFFITNVALPQIGAYAQALLEPTIAIIIAFAGLVMVFGAVGIKISENLGSTITNGIFRGIGHLFRYLFSGIAWIVKAIGRLLPQVFTGSRKTFAQMGLNPLLSNVLAILVTTVILLIII